jgi:hypothetical protein
MNLRAVLPPIVAAALAGCAHPRPAADLAWARADDGPAEARLVVATVAAGDLRLVMSCRPGSRVVELTALGDPGDSALVTLESGKLASRHSGAGADDPGLGGFAIQTRMWADDPVLARFADTGELRLDLGRRRIRLPNGFAPGHDFLKTCRG